MCTPSDSGTPVPPRRHSGTHLPKPAARRLESVFTQMDLLLRTRDERDALRHLVRMLRHLRAVREEWHRR